MNTNATQTFTPGSTYAMRSVCDHNARWAYKVERRTAQTVHLVDVHSGEKLALRVKVWSGVEQVKPLGSYSMAPILSADRLA